MGSCLKGVSAWVRVRVRVRRSRVRVRARGRVRVEDISAKTRASSVNPLNNSYYLVGILCLDSPTIRVRVRVRYKFERSDRL